MESEQGTSGVLPQGGGILLALGCLCCTRDELYEFANIRGAPSGYRVPAFLGGEAFDGDERTIGVFASEGVVATDDVMYGLWGGCTFANAVKDWVEEADALAQGLIEKGGNTCPLR